jgi:hypothetical protein
VVFGQSFEIRGQIIEQNTPLSFVTVLVFQQPKTTQKIPEYTPRTQSIELSNYSVILGHGKDRYYRPW